jgi:hypothetical protein
LAELIHYAVSHQIIHIHAIPAISAPHHNAVR